MATDSELCARLDDVVMRFFATLSELDGKKAELEALMSDGFMQLSKSRYDMGSGVGNRSIGAAMYDRANMKATVNVIQRRLPDHHADSFELVNPADLCLKTSASEKGSSPGKSQGDADYDAPLNTNCDISKSKENASTFAPSPDGLRFRKGKEDKSQSIVEDDKDDEKRVSSSFFSHYPSSPALTKATTLSRISGRPFPA